jgi:putative endonuclease
MFYVYCLESLNLPNRRYCGFTEDLPQRLSDHNDGCNPTTAAGRPWRIKGYVAFDNKPRALAFERYLKSGSGHAFRKKRLW